MLLEVIFNLRVTQNSMQVKCSIESHVTHMLHEITCE